MKYIIKLFLSVYFHFLSVPTQKCKITYMAYHKFLLNNADLYDYSSLSLSI